MRETMLVLPEVQRRMRAALLGEAAPAAAAIVRGDGLAPEARLAIYRHHVQTTLTDALASTFPVVCRLVDRRFFAYAAEHYIRERPPARPCLHEYGEDFAEFLATFPACRSLGYLPDVARLEWGLNRADHADDVASLDRTRLAKVPAHRLPGLVLRLHPAITVLASVWPIDEIWRANQPDADADASVDVTAGPVVLEVTRVEDHPVFRRLEPAEYRFRKALAAGRPLGAAAQRAFSAALDFDLALALHQLLTEGAIVDVIDPSDKEIER